VCTLLLEGYRAGLRTEGKRSCSPTAETSALVKLTKDTQEDPKSSGKELDLHDNPRIDAADLAKRARGHVPRLVSTRREAGVPGAEVAGGLGSLGGGASPPWRSRKRRAASTQSQALVPLRPVLVDGQTTCPRNGTLLQHAIRDPDPHFQCMTPGWSATSRRDVAKIEMPENKRDKRLVPGPGLLPADGPGDGQHPSRQPQSGRARESC